jgi:hypothetical protein
LLPAAVNDRVADCVLSETETAQVESASVRPAVYTFTKIVFVVGLSAVVAAESDHNHPGNIVDRFGDIGQQRRDRYLITGK